MRKKKSITSTAALSLASFALASAGNASYLQNPPDLEVVNPEDTFNLIHSWGTYGNVTAISDGMVTSPEGVNLYPTEENHEFSVLGTTKIQLKAAEDGASNVYGIRASTSSNGKVASLFSLHDVDIYVETSSTRLNRAKGIWVYGGYNPVGEAPSVIVPSILTIDGTLKVTAKTNDGYAIGINAGDEYNANGEGNGEIYLKGSSNEIYIEQTGSRSESYARASAGILASDGGKVFIEGNSSQTIIDIKTANRGGTVIQGGIVLDKSGIIQTEGALNILGEATANYENHLQGISADYTGSYVYTSTYGSNGTFNGTTNIVLKGTSWSYLSGIGAYGASSLTFNNSLSVELEGSESVKCFDGIRASSTYLDITSYDLPGNAASGGVVNINAGLRVSLPEDVAPGLSNIYSLHSIGMDGLTRAPSITVDGDIEDEIALSGNVDASKGGMITLAMRNAASSLTGWADNHSNSTIDMTLANDAVWNVVSKFSGQGVTSETSRVSTLTLDGGILDMTYLTKRGHDAWESAGHRQVLEINGSDSNGSILSGTGGTIRMDVNLADEGTTADGLNLDQIIVHGNATGSHTLEVNFVNGLDNVPTEKWVSENWLIHQDGGDMTLTGPGGRTSIAGNGMVTLWDVKFVPDGQSDQLSDEAFRDSLVNTSNGKGDWYLVRHDELGWTDLEPSTPLPAEPGAVIDVGSTVAQAVSWMSEKNDLRRRLGEVRYGSQAGVWAKAFNRKDRASGFSTKGFEQRSSGVHVGYDTLVASDESSSWLLGATFRYAQSDQEGLETANGGSGEMDEYSGKVYATWMHDSGAYADLIAQVGYYRQDVDGYTNDFKGRWKASYDLWGYGASVEIGHMLTLKNGSDDRRWHNHWFLEPQLELSYFHVDGANFQLSTGMGVHQSNADFLTGRAGFVLGKKFNYGTLDDLDRRYFQLGLIAGVTHEFMGEQDLTFTGTEGATVRVHGEGLGGTSVYYGFTADWQASDRWRFYAELDREEGEHYTKEYGINVGFKYLID